MSTTTFTITLGFVVHTPGSDEDFDAHTDAVMDDLMECDGIYDADMTVGLAARTVEITASVDAMGSQAALDTAFGAIRSAVHANHGVTAGWEDALARAKASVAPQRVEADELAAV